MVYAFEDDFNDNYLDTEKWSLDKVSQCSVYERNQRLEIEPPPSDGVIIGEYIITAKQDFDITGGGQGFFVEADVYCISGSPAIWVGLRDMSAFSYILMNDSGVIKAIKMVDNTPTLLGSKTADASLSTLKIEQNGNRIYFYENDSLITSVENELPTNRVYVGLHGTISNEQQTVWYDNFHVWSGELIWTTTTTELLMLLMNLVYLIFVISLLASILRAVHE